MRSTRSELFVLADHHLDLIEACCLAHLHREAQAAWPARVEADVDEAVLDRALHIRTALNLHLEGSWRGLGHRAPLRRA